jgi:hypothetical protein
VTPESSGHNLPVPRATVEQIVECRDKAMVLYEDAYAALLRADDAVKAAHAMVNQAAPTGTNNYTYDHIEEIAAFQKAIQLPDREQFLRTARKLTDLCCWGYIVQMTDLERLMDVQAKEQLRNQMRYVQDRPERRGHVITETEAAKGMPPITVENIYATLEAFRADAGMIFRRGIANAFSKLDRRFKSHDGFKLGSRIILTRAFNDYGRLEYGRTRDTLVDVERVFAILDGHQEGSFTSTLHMLERERGGYNPHQSQHESAYFRVRCFMNGNAHLWFTRDDLVRKVNKLLAEYYGEVIADGQQAEADPLAEKKTTPARRFGFFPTPAAAVDELFSDRYRNGGPCIIRRASEPRLRILEPSAGTGNIARRCVNSIAEMDGWAGGRSCANEYRFDNMVDCVEIQPELAAGLEAEGIYNRVIRADFLSLRPGAFEPYDLVVMNPPFDLERDIDHVTHALGFLKHGGDLFAIMSAGTEFRETRKAAAFRDLTQQWGGSTRDLPPGSFKESGTYVNTIIVHLRKPNAVGAAACR